MKRVKDRADYFQKIKMTKIATNCELQDIEIATKTNKNVPQYIQDPPSQGVVSFISFFYFRLRLRIRLTLSRVLVKYRF